MPATFTILHPHGYTTPPRAPLKKQNIIGASAGYKQATPLGFPNRNTSVPQHQPTQQMPLAARELGRLGVHHFLAFTALFFTTRTAGIPVGWLVLAVRRDTPPPTTAASQGHSEKLPDPVRARTWRVTMRPHVSRERSDTPAARRYNTLSAHP